MKLKEEINLSSTCTINVQSDCGNISIWDLYDDYGQLYGQPTLSIGEEMWDNTVYVHEALEDLLQGNKETEHYKLLKKDVKDQGFNWKTEKKTLKRLYRDAVQMGLFSKVNFS